MNNTPWEQTKPLTAANVERILRDNFAQLFIHSLSMLGEGWDNTTWLINNELVFRLPKHQQAATLIINEMRVLSHLPDLSVNVPTPLYPCYEPNGFPYAFYGHPLITGQTADRCQLTQVERHQLTIPIAQFLKTLHAFSIHRAEKLDIGYDRLGRVAIRERFGKVKERLSYLAYHNVIESAQPFLAQYQRYIDLEIPNVWVLAHGDFYARHLILDEHRRLTGVIDWGDSELIHPAVDLAIVYQFLPLESHQIFWREYGSVSETTKTIAKLRAIYSATTIAWYAHHIKDNMLLEENVKALTALKDH